MFAAHLRRCRCNQIDKVMATRRCNANRHNGGSFFSRNNWRHWRQISVTNGMLDAQLALQPYILFLDGKQAVVKWSVIQPKQAVQGLEAKDTRLRVLVDQSNPNILRI